MKKCKDAERMSTHEFEINKRTIPPDFVRRYRTLFRTGFRQKNSPSGIAFIRIPEKIFLRKEQCLNLYIFSRLYNFVRAHVLLESDRSTLEDIEKRTFVKRNSTNSSVFARLDIQLDISFKPVPLH